MYRAALLSLTVIAVALKDTSASAMMLITSDRGGLISDYAERFSSARATGEWVVIDGACLSACTLVVGMLPRDRVYATSKAVLGFHSAWRPKGDSGRVNSLVASQAMLEVYPRSCAAGSLDEAASNQNDPPRARARANRNAMWKHRRANARAPHSGPCRIGHDSRS
jgi:hypothetical protein